MQWRRQQLYECDSERQHLDDPSSFSATANGCALMEPPPASSLPPRHSTSATLKRGQKRKHTSPTHQPPARVPDAPNKGFVGVRWRQYPYGIRFIPRVRVPKTRYDLPLGEYRTCEEAALVRDVAAFYYGKKGAFNYKNDYPSCLPEISSDLSRQEKIDWVSARAKERGRTLYSNHSLGTTSTRNTSSSTSSSSQPLTQMLPPPLPLTLPFVSRSHVTPQPGVTIATSGHHVQKPWLGAPVVPLPLESYAFLHARKRES
ncbi:hypothetical protein KC19_3G214300 [Ceratodon purpureus]|uniref:AP2/ERF domain-containing protein n=1 Tax=Ceratodon purpureus TaxID=3225 RepID=A0A8T0IMP7_CERPU|nr:hypothetical protein KC19_3G214300 [Ceratodon purpureus]